MPRAPQRRALLAANPLAKRSVLASRVSRARSIPCKSERSTRLTLGTGIRAAWGQAAKTKAPADSKSQGSGAWPASFSRLAAIRSSAFEEGDRPDSRPYLAAAIAVLNCAARTCARHHPLALPAVVSRCGSAPATDRRLFGGEQFPAAAPSGRWDS